MNSYICIDNWRIQRLRERYPNYQIDGYLPSKTWQTSRYIQFFIEGCSKDIHYEYRIGTDWVGRVELHFEGDWHNQYQNLIDYLVHLTQGNDDLSWQVWEWGYRCQYTKEIGSENDLFLALSYMMNTFDNAIQGFRQGQTKTESQTLVQDITLPLTRERVELFELKYDDILRLPLSIPNYQRIYCWEQHHLMCLLDDVFDYMAQEHENTPAYRLGTIILHAHNGKYDIIDGQQRLISLALLISELGLQTPLLQERLSSRLSLDYVAYNKYLIQGYLEQKGINRPQKLTQIRRLLEFSVLVLQNTSIDLAYTFFSNQNSRGVPLSDYDLLKAHHLRYIPSGEEGQAERNAESWNRMVDDGRQEELPDYVCTLDTYVYRLRQWKHHQSCENQSKNRYIKRAYEAAHMIESISSTPPSTYHFDDSIEGGKFFFSFVEYHLSKYKTFIRTEEYKKLHRQLQGGSHTWYREVIEAILYAYYLKFGENYLTEALLSIMRIILQHRYETFRAKKSTIIEHRRNKELVLIIDRATAPTFFLGATLHISKSLYYPNGVKPIQKQMKEKAARISQTLADRIQINAFKKLNNV